jgi:hypothetical protein
LDCDARDHDAPSKAKRRLQMNQTVPTFLLVFLAAGLTACRKPPPASPAPVAAKPATLPVPTTQDFTLGIRGLSFEAPSIRIPSADSSYWYLKRNYVGGDLIDDRQPPAGTRPSRNSP